MNVIEPIRRSAAPAVMLWFVEVTVTAKSKNIPTSPVPIAGSVKSTVALSMSMTDPLIADVMVVLPDEARTFRLDFNATPLASIAPENVVAPDTRRVEDKVTAPVTPRVEPSEVALRVLSPACSTIGMYCSRY